jgi:hypothetical protein
MFCLLQTLMSQSYIAKFSPRYYEFYLSYVRPLLTTEAIRLNILYLFQALSNCGHGV